MGQQLEPLTRRELRRRTPTPLKRAERQEQVAYSVLFLSIAALPLVLGSLHLGLLAPLLVLLAVAGFVGGVRAGKRVRALHQEHYPQTPQAPLHESPFQSLEASSGLGTSMLDLHESYSKRSSK